MKPAYVLGIAAALVVAFFFGTLYGPIRQQPLPAPETGPSATAVRSLELQKMCAEQAAKAFKDGGDTQRRQNVLNSYENHYSTKLGKCFMVWQTLDSSKVASEGTGSNFAFLTDAFDGVNLGNFMSQTRKGEVGEKVVICQMTPIGKDETSCQTQDEWDRFVANYMQN